MTLLLIEDEAKTSENIGQYLSSQGFGVFYAYNIEDAKRICQEYKIDIIFTDLQLPDGNGLDFLEELRGYDKKTPAYVITGHVSEEYLLRAVRLKLEDYIIKPVTSKKLETLIDGFFASKKLKREMLCPQKKIVYSFEHRCIYKASEQISLTNKEILFLELLLSNKNKIASYSDIERFVYAEGQTTRNAIKSLVTKLRAKLGANIIESLHGMGYKVSCD